MDRPKANERNEAIRKAAASDLGVEPDRIAILMACDFCGRDTEQVEFLIAGTAVMDDVDVHICPDCVEVCSQLVQDRRAGTYSPAESRP